MSGRPSLRRSVLGPLSLGFAVLLAVFTALLYFGQQRHLDDARSRDRTSVERFLRTRIRDDAELMNATLNAITRDASLRSAFRARDRAALRVAVQPTFDDLQRRHNIASLYFMTADRVVLLRMHRPEAYGDTIPRFSLMEAARTGQVVSGLELGQLRGLFTLRVVVPWRDQQNHVIGYIELGEEIAHFAEELKTVLGVEVFVTIRKDLLERQNWESVSRRFGRTPDWAQFPDDVLLDQTMAVPAALEKRLNSPSDRPADYLDVRAEDRRYLGAALPLLDVTEQQVGQVIFLRDRTMLIANTHRSVALSAFLAIVVAVICTLLLYSRAQRNYILPLLELRAVAERAGQGELSQVAIVHRADEIGDLARSINRMILDLRAAQAEQTRLVLDAALDAVVTFDSSGQVIDWNRQAERLLGSSRGEAIGKPVLDLFGLGGARSVLERVLEDYRESGNSGTFNRLLEDSVHRREGTPIPVEMAITPVRGAGGLVFSAFLRDVSDRMRLQEELQAAQRLDAIGKLAGGIAHDFNNLITAIVGYVGSVQNALEPGTQAHEDTLEIRRAADRATALVQQLLAFARKRVVQPRSVHCNELVTSLDRMLRRLIGDAVRLETQLEPALWPVVADPVQLEQVLINLTVNARDAMPDGGNIIVQTANVVISGVLSFDGAVPPGNYVMIGVSDTGTGMSQETITHIFEPFFTTKPASKGTGLGLATCYGIIKQAGGYIRVTSARERGTSFRIYLPRAEPSESDAGQPAKHNAASGAPETILLAEDEDQVRRLIERALRQQGYTIISATNGLEALEISRTYAGTIHLLLTDVVMPELSGREAAAAIRRERTDIRVVFMSGYSEELARLQGELSETAAFIAKPFAPDELRRVIRDVLDAVTA